MTMIERVARVLATHAGDGRDYTDVARAIIEEMREPTEWMIGSRDARSAGYAGDIDDVWRDMIDAALTEKS